MNHSVENTTPLIMKNKQLQRALNAFCVFMMVYSSLFRQTVVVVVVVN